MFPLPFVVALVLTVPVSPLMAWFSIITMLRMALTPSASSLAPGSVMTSMRFTKEAGMERKSSFAFLLRLGS